MTKERFSQETKSYMRELIHDNARYDELAEQYVMDISDLTKRQTERLAAYMMLHDPELAKEAVGPDNSFFNNMMNRLINYMKDTKDVVTELAFLNVWARHVKHYFTNEIEDLIEIQLDEFNGITL